MATIDANQKVDRHLRISVLATLAIFALTAAVLVFGGHLPAVAFPAVAV